MLAIFLEITMQYKSLILLAIITSNGLCTINTYEMVGEIMNMRSKEQYLCIHSYKCMLRKDITRLFIFRRFCRLHINTWMYFEKQIALRKGRYNGRYHFSQPSWYLVVMSLSFYAEAISIYKYNNTSLIYVIYSCIIAWTQPTESTKY